MPLRSHHRMGLPDPYDELRRIQVETNRLQREIAGRSGIHRITGTSEFPPINLWEGEHDILVIAQVPGVDAESLEITAQDGALGIKGTVAPEPESTDAPFHRRERHYGAFGRTLRLPFDVDPDKVQADCTNGVLRIYLPRPETKKPKRIKIAKG